MAKNAAVSLLCVCHSVTLSFFEEMDNIKGHPYFRENGINFKKIDGLSYSINLRPYFQDPKWIEILNNKVLQKDYAYDEDMFYYL